MDTMNFIQKNWFPILMLGVLLYMLINSQGKLEKYEKEKKEFEEKIKSLEKTVAKDMKIIDSLKTRDTVYVDRIKTIKEKADEKIKLVDTMSVSTMQGFFADRYPVKE